jgi:hypothetical protein
MTLSELRQFVAAVFQGARNVAPPPGPGSTEEEELAAAVIVGWLEASGDQIAQGQADGLLIAAAAQAAIPVETDA